VAAPSFVTAAVIKLTSRLESTASYRNTMDKFNAKRATQSSRESPFIVTGLTQIAAIKGMVDFVLIGIIFKRSTHQVI
jgi:hypothetical protein